MGMFDYVQYKGYCPECLTEITDWQSKDAGCNLETVSVDQVDRFYTSCPKCGAWVEGKVEKVSFVKGITIYSVPQAKLVKGKKDED